MSTVVREVKGRDLGHIVRLNNGNHCYVDSNNTFDCGYETMVFACDESGRNIDWSDLYCEHYRSYADMKKRHEYIINHLEEVLQNE